MNILHRELIERESAIAFTQYTDTIVDFWFADFGAILPEGVAVANALPHLSLLTLTVIIATGKLKIF